MAQIESTSAAAAPRPRIGMRLWLGAAFATLALVTAGVVFYFETSTSEDVLSDRATELAIGRTSRLADQVAQAGSDPADVISGATDTGFKGYFFDTGQRLVAPTGSSPQLDALPSKPTALTTALAGGRFVEEEPHDITLVAVPVFGASGVSGAVVGVSSKSAVLRSALDRLRSDSLRAFVVAIAIAVLVGFLVASIIAYRVKRLARSAGEMAGGALDVPLKVGGRDEIGDLARALDAMREALRGSFELLSAERDKLSAIFSRLTDAVMVVDADGAVQFSNPAAELLLDSSGKPVEPLSPCLRAAAERGTAEVAALRVGERVYAVQARNIPAEGSVLAVVRDRTAELQREIAERDFVSNAAHELRNPLAGISGAIEVLQAHAKDDPEARDHFIERLSVDAERMSRLTKSLLTLARVEALGPAEAEVVDVEAAAEDALAAAGEVEGVEVVVDLEPDLTAKGDPTLLRQVLIGLLSNALKHTSAPGTVTLRGSSDGAAGVRLEVIDTGTGIPPEEVERVFERFYRGSDSLQREGFGLGLAIARRMVDVMGGEIGATSEEGKGSTFWVRLPVAAPTRTPVA